LSTAGGGETRLRERLRAERDERRRLAELVHDGPVQHLAALGQILDAATLAFEQGDAAGARELVGRAREIARETAVDLRDVIAGFEPATLHEAGFAAAVDELAGRVAGRRGVAVQADLPAANLLGEAARSGLFQIVYLAIDQAVRRGPPTRVSVALHQTPVGGVELSVVDDGARERRQAVLDTVRERADDLNAVFEAVTGDGQTEIRVTLPPSAAYL
jgi:signal transduction histidine kinase